MDNIYIPSYNRSDLVRTYEYLGCGHIVVPESQEKKYKKRYGSAVISIPDNKDGFVAKKRNAVIDIIKEKEADGYGWVCDDDFICLRRKKENIKMTGDECLEHFERLYIMAKDMGAKYGGFDYSSDNIKLKDMTPFSLTKGVFQVALINVLDGIRYDERFRINEDVEFFIQKMNNNRFMIRDNQYVTQCYGEDGGKNSTIGYDREEQKKYAKMINDKWGYGAMVWRKTRFEFKHPISGA
jgi:hypothetical protein